MKTNFHNTALDLPGEKAKSLFSPKHLPKSDLLIKLSPLVFIILTAIIFKSWPILFALVYLPVQFFIKALIFCFDIAKLDIDYKDIIQDLEG